MLEVNGVQKSLNNKPILRDISFTVEQGSTFAVLGTAGSGKTSLMNILAGCMTPSSGRVLWNGRNIYQSGPEFLRRIGYMPAKLSLYPEMTVCEYLSYILRIKGIRDKHGVKLGELLEEAMLLDQLNALTSSLDAYEQARLKLAQALAGDIELLLLDEPTAGLKPNEIELMRTMLRRLRGKYTMVLASQMLREATDLCEEILIINRGKIAVNTSITRLTNHASGVSMLKVRMGAPREKLAQFIKSLREEAEVDVLPSLEDGATDLMISSAQGVDMRRVIWKKSIEQQIPMLEMNLKEVSLEEIFLQMTGESYRF